MSLSNGMVRCPLNADCLFAFIQPNTFKIILVLSSVVVRANHHICARFGLKLTPES